MGRKPGRLPVSVIVAVFHSPHVARSVTTPTQVHAVADDGAAGHARSLWVALTPQCVRIIKI
jgi:hypothetical protein